MRRTEDLKLKPKKKSFLRIVSDVFADKKRRYLYLFLAILPFLIAIGVFGFIVFRDAKSLLAMATGNTEIKDENIISSMNYVLRDNATDVQKECFAQLKEAIESSADDATIAGLVCENYVADFYTWSNKAGQYDVGGLYYVYEPQKETIYTQARDGMYKYLSTYIKDYGASNLLEVDNVEVKSAKKRADKYQVDENTYNAFDVQCEWTYKENDKFSAAKYAKKMYFIVIDNGKRFEIVEASTNPIVITAIEETTKEETTEEVAEDAAQ